MKPLGRRRRHYWLVQRMARATGADLMRAWQAGELRQRDWAAMVGRCRGCPCPQHCERLLTRNEAASPPKFCLNANTLAKIRRIGQEEG